MKEIAKEDIINMLLDYNKKYNASEYKMLYKTDEDFINNIKDIMEYNPLDLIDYVHITLLKQICYFENLDTKAKTKMNILSNILFNVSLYLRNTNETMQKYYKNQNILLH